MKQLSIREQVLRKPGPVQEVLKILATRHEIEQPFAAYMDNIENHMAWALENWQQNVVLAENVGISEVEFAEAVIQKLRKEPQHGWSKILRGKAN